MANPMKLTSDPVQSRVALPAANPPDNQEKPFLVGLLCEPFLWISRLLMFSIKKIKREWFTDIRSNVLSGIVVALALIPEAIGFSIIAGVDPRVGLYASVVIAI